MSRRSILDRRSRRKIKKDFELPLTSMMDMLIILIVFLLKSYSSDTNAFTAANKITLPLSNVKDPAVQSVNLVVEPSGIIVDQDKVLEFKPSAEQLAGQETTADKATYEFQNHQLGDGGRKILPVFDALIRQKEKAEILMSKAVWKDTTGKATTPKFEGVLIIQADKNVRYELLKKIMYTAGAAQYKTFKLVTVRKEEG